MKQIYSLLFSGKNKYASVALCVALCGFFAPIRSNGQTNIGLTAVASQSSGGVTIYSPANYNDNVIVSWAGCSGYGTCPTPWGWVFNAGYIDYTWSAPVTFNKVVFYFADRPMNACTFQYWNGSAFVNFLSYTMAFCNADSVTFPPVTTTILRFNNCVAPLINPNFREIQVWQSGPPPPTIIGTTTYCTGSTVTLTATSTATAPTYSWTGPAAFSATTATISFTASPATAGVYSCTVTSGGVTSTPALDTIVVVPPPAITLGTVSPVCQGVTTASLPYSATTGTPTTYNIVYSPAAITAGFVNVTSAALPASPITLAVPAGSPAGVFTGTLTVNNAVCSGAGLPISIPINPNPAAITGLTNVCTGSTSALGDATTGGTWSSSNTVVATIGSSSGVLNGLTVGSSTIQYILPTGCFTTATANVVGISGPTHVCAGDSVNLTATSTGGVWSTSNPSVATITPAGVISGVAMGVVQVSYTLPLGCTALWAFSVNPLAPILGRDSVCVLSSGYVTDIVGGGTWSSTITAVATILPDSGKITGVAAGITTISYLLPTGCLTTRPFTVIDYPGAITGTRQLCANGGTTPLGDPTGGGTWSSSNASIASVNPGTGLVTGVVAGTANITYTIEPGCPVEAQVIVNPLPDPVTGPSVLCPGTSDVMHDATKGGLWSSSALPVMTIVDTNGTISALTGGSTIIRYQLPTGCLQSTTVSVDPIPVPAIFYNYLLNTFFATPGYVSYQWYDSSQGKIPGATSPTLAAAQTMYYYVEVTDSNGCKGFSPYYYFNINSVGVKNYVHSGDIKIYPNPATATVYISSPVTVRAVVSSMDGKKEIEVADAKSIDVSQLASGMYMITLFDEDGVRLTVQKLVKE